MTKADLPDEILEFYDEHNKEIKKHAKKVVEDYKNNPPESEASGSIVQVHMNSPVLKDDIIVSIEQEDDGEY